MIQRNKKSFLSTIAAACLAAAPMLSFATPTDTPSGKFSAIGDPSQLIACTLAAFPGGYVCGSAVSLGQIFSTSQMDGVLTNFGCSKAPGANIYNCLSSAQLPGIIIYYTYTGTNDVSRIIYIA